MSKRKNVHQQPEQQPTVPPNTPKTLADSAASPEGSASPVHPATIAGASATHHILFGAVEDVLADLHEQGAPDGNIVRVERLVRNRQHTMGGVATQGVLITARRNDEVLSAWVVVGRLSLDPRGQPLDHERARASAERHREAQRVIGAQVADAGFAVRTGLYLLPDAGYGFAATSASLETLDTLGALAAWAVPDENAPETTAPAREAATPTEELEGDAKHA
ncbi:MAG: hypothetical protein ABI068_11260 [Ktedonobacterales bacterium]